MTNHNATLADDAALQLEHDFVQIVREQIGMHEAMATMFARALVRGLRQQLGGQKIYVPAPDRAARDEAIRREFTGSNLDDLVRRHGIGRARIYKIAAQPQSRQRIGIPAAKNPLPSLESGRQTP